jgi:3-hydroxy-9,10-secoandrosta-1,3,5(10)-triene-9,17-dione monooxygenase
VTTIDVPRPAGPDAATYLDGVREILPRLKERSAATERARCLPAESIADIEATGLFAALQPRRHGGLELDPATFFESVVEVGSACGAAGWVAGVLAAHPWEIGCMHPDAQADVWARDETTRVSSSYAPTGSARRVDDGYLVSGRWGFSSGVDHCAWVLLGSFVAGEEELGPRVFLVARDDFEIDQESWQVSGLAGTGSKDVHVAGATVPEHRTHLLEHLRDPSHACEGWAVNDGPLYRLPWTNLFTWAIAAPALGAATGLVREYVEQSKQRVGAFGGPPVARNVALHERLAEAVGRVDMLRRAMRSSWQEVYAAAGRGEAVDPVEAARARYAGARTIAASLEAALTVFAQAGGSAMNATNPLQRYLRDLLAMRNHPMAALDRFATDQALLELDVPPKA